MTSDRRENTSVGGDLAKRLARRRRALGLTQEEVANRADMDPGYVNHLEHHPAAPTVGTLIQLADALDTTVAELLGSIPERAPGHGRASLRPVLAKMTDDECRHLLAAGGVGRIAFASDQQLIVVPVNFAVSGDDIVFRTSETAAITRYGAGPAAFEVDRIDDGMRTGWSILIAGRVRRAAGDELDRLRSAQPVEPWAGGDREVYVVMEVEQISGRRIHPW